MISRRFIAVGLLALITHLQRRPVRGSWGEHPLAPASRLPADFDLARFELAETAGQAMAMLCADAKNDCAARLRQALGSVRREKLAHGLTWPKS